jgi:acetyl esterase/lipase
MFLMGHSAGGHLVALLATDDCYLKAEGLTIDHIKGVIAVSGVYHIPPGRSEYTLGGETPAAFRFRQIGPLRRDGPPESKRLCSFPGIPMNLDPYWLAFGSDATKREDASPVKHVHPGLPPFLLLVAQDDLPTLPDMAAEFHGCLKTHGVESQLIKIESRNHSSICFRAIQSEDPAARAMLAFIRGRSALQTHTDPTTAADRRPLP